MVDAACGVSILSFMTDVWDDIIQISQELSPQAVLMSDAGMIY